MFSESFYLFIVLHFIVSQSHKKWESNKPLRNLGFCYEDLVQDIWEAGNHMYHSVQQESAKFLFGDTQWFVLNIINKISEDRYLEL